MRVQPRLEESEARAFSAPRTWSPPAGQAPPCQWSEEDRVVSAVYPNLQMATDRGRLHRARPRAGSRTRACSCARAALLLPGHPPPAAGTAFAARWNPRHAPPEGCSAARAPPWRPPILYLGPLLLRGKSDFSLHPKDQQNPCAHL